MVSAQCSGTPPVYGVSTSTSFCDFCTFSLSLWGAPISSGQTYQWQRSSTDVPIPAAWTNIPGATTVPYTHSPSAAPIPFFGGNCYYRCKVYCTASGDSSISGSVYVPNHFFMYARPTVAVPGTTCNMVRFYIDMQTAPNTMVKTDYGDGTQDSVMPYSGPLGWYVQHLYAHPGNYRITHKLYYNNIFQDSFSRNEEFYPCDVLPVLLYMTADADCEMNGSEQYNAIPLKVAIDSNGVPIDTISALSGISYKAQGPTGTVYGFRPLPGGGRSVSCPASGIVYDTLDTMLNVPVRYIGMTCAPGGEPDLAVHMVVPVTGPLDQWGHVYVRNNNCALTDATVKLRYSHKYGTSTSWILPPSAMVFPTMTWYLPGMSNTTGLRDIFYTAWASMSTLLTPDDTVTEEVLAISTTGTEIILDNNIITRTDTVKASCDPNYIAVNPPGCFDTASRFQFTVHFENTGNDTAHNIYVLDTLSEYLDPNSLELVMSSAKIMNITPYTEGGHNIVKFNFPKIKLLDSSWHGLNDGAFIYNIRTRPGLPLGVVIKSRVGIYFDLNDAVMTNTTENLKGCPVIPVSVNSAGITKPLLYPNPAADELFITVANGTYTSFIVANSIGQKILLQDIKDTTTKVTLDMIPAGLYHIIFKGEAGATAQRFVKW